MANQIDPKTVTTAGEFDVAKFNKKFEEISRREQEEKSLKERERLLKMSQSIRKKKLHELTVGEIILNFKDAIYGIIDELVYFKFTSMNEFYDIFMKEKRLFYIGLLFMLLSTIVLIIEYLFIEQDPLTVLKSNIYNSYNTYRSYEE